MSVKLTDEDYKQAAISALPQALMIASSKQRSEMLTPDDIIEEAAAIAAACAYQLMLRMEIIANERQEISVTVDRSPRNPSTPQEALQLMEETV